MAAQNNRGMNPSDALQQLMAMGDSDWDNSESEGEEQDLGEEVNDSLLDPLDRVQAELDESAVNGTEAVHVPIDHSPTSTPQQEVLHPALDLDDPVPAPSQPTHATLIQHTSTTSNTSTSLVVPTPPPSQDQTSMVSAGPINAQSISTTTSTPGCHLQ